MSRWRSIPPDPPARADVSARVGEADARPRYAAILASAQHAPSTMTRWPGDLALAIFAGCAVGLIAALSAHHLVLGLALGTSVSGVYFVVTVTRLRGPIPPQIRVPGRGV